MKQQAMNDQNNSNNNWLGFSLSPQMKMELSSTSSDLHHNPYRHQVQSTSTTTTTPSSSAVPTSFYLSPSQLTNWVGETAGFHSPLSVMPLKSDGSLCIMEALSRSQPEGMVPSSSPKLEDFLGGASMGAHDQYGSQEREAMALSLDSIYYNNNNHNAADHHHHHHHQSAQETNRDNNPHPLDLLQHPFRPNQQQQYYSGIPCHGIYQTQLGEVSGKDMHTIGECDPEISSNWVAAAAAAARQYSGHHSLEQQQMNGSTNVVEENNSGGVSGPVGGGIGCGELQSLTLSMSPGSQSSCITAPRQISPTGTECMAMETKKRGPGKVTQKQTPVHRKSIDTFGQRTSQFRGVTRHRWTGRYEAHLWDNSCKKEGQTRKGRQGGYDMEEKAARAYDLAALKYWGPSTHINFPLENYQTELEDMKKMTRQEYVAHLRRKSSGFSRGASMYRGVTRHHQHGRWQARIGRVAGNKDLYLGTFSTQEEAAEAYDIAAIKFRGVNAVTNFEITRYDVEKIMASNTLLAGELARRNKETEPSTDHNHHHHHQHQHQHQAVDYNPSSQMNGEINDNPESNSLGNGTGPDWKMALYQSQNPCLDSLDQKSISSGSYRNASFSMSLQDLIGIDSVSSGAQQPLVEHQESAKLGASTHFSNPSSLVTSLSSSREGSPDKTGPTNAMLFARPPLASKFINPTSGVSSWFPSQLRPPTAISMGHLPVFAAWNDT
ncbi:AP2-like ethylene-responsive transcription factor ANT [Morus notabilis]|uniref:AP2-like ethylene-responsive transcription factor ANT n=1 Tax=Morus notabilis TaxID=981085 RepID=W9S2G4_9ROSA|nr:AP2-like ethylene-responsive transcription factor ANT [Morus notabilis]